MTEKQLKKKILDSGRTLLFSNEDLKRLIIPLVIDQVLVRTVGMADTMMISSAVSYTHLTLPTRSAV